MIDLAAYKAWLTELPPSQIVGRGGIGCSCPIAQYIKTQIVPPGIYVYTSYNIGEDPHAYLAMKGDEPLQCQRLPHWCFAFMGKVDAALDLEDVTAEAALKLLAECGEHGTVA